MSLRPFKFVIQAVFLEEQDGRVVGERTTEPAVLYADSLVSVAEQFDKQLSEALGADKP